LWGLSGGTVGDRIRRHIVAVLVPEPTNPYDANAIAVQIDGQVIGYLPRATAQDYLPGLQRLMSVRNGYVALRGVIVGGGYYDDGPGRLGVWLEHDPADFGVRSASLGSAPPGYASADGVMRTGFTEAWLTDAEDDSYDLSWFNDLPDADRPAIAKLRELLAADPDPIDRHFQFAELEARLYRSRDLYESALAEYDEACARHDAEMEGICAAFMTGTGARGRVSTSANPSADTSSAMAMPVTCPSRSARPIIVREAEITVRARPANSTRSPMPSSPGRRTALTGNRPSLG
jgi:hypothetical protein